MAGSAQLPTSAKKMLKAINEKGEAPIFENEKTLSLQTIPFIGNLQSPTGNKETSLQGKFDGEIIALKPVVIGGTKCPSCGSDWSSDDPAANNWVYGNATVFLDFGIFKATGKSVYETVLIL